MKSFQLIFLTNFTINYEFIFYEIVLKLTNYIHSVILILMNIFLFEILLFKEVNLALISQISKTALFIPFIFIIKKPLKKQKLAFNLNYKQILI